MKILLVNTKFLGDLIISSPGLKSVRKKFPDAEITLLVRKGYEDGVKNNPYINRIMAFDFGVKKDSFFSRLRDEINFIGSIVKERYDAVVSFHPGDRTAFLAWLSGAKIRIAPRKQPFGFFFNVKVDVEEDTISYLDYYNRIASALTGEPGELKTEYFVSSEERACANEFFIENEIDSNGLIIGIHPGASEPTKIWQEEKFAELIKNIAAIPESKIILIAGPKETSKAARIRSAVHGLNVSLFNSDDINKTAAVMERIRLLVSNDSAARHLAVALGIPVIALMPADNQNCWNFYDNSASHYVLSGERIFPEEGQPYLGKISPDEVFQKIKEVLKLK